MTSSAAALLALWLTRLGARTTGLALGVPTDPSLYELARVAEDVEHVEADVRDLDAVERTVAAARPEVVIHMAAQPLVRRAYEDPLGTYAVNVMGTANVLEAARRAGGVGAVLVVTSDKCYENPESGRPHEESDPLGGRDPYSASKAAAEHVTAGYRHSFSGLATASARAGNVIGGGDWSDDRLVPDVMGAALAGGTARIRNPDAVRPWQHVLNPVSGYLRLVEALCESSDYAEPWNFGPREEDSRTVRELLDLLEARWGEALPWELDEEAGPAEARLLRLDSSKAAERLGWQPRWGLEEAVGSIVSFYRALTGGADMRAVVEDQIAAFEAGSPP